MVNLKSVLDYIYCFHKFINDEGDTLDYTDCIIILILLDCLYLTYQQSNILNEELVVSNNCKLLFGELDIENYLSNTVPTSCENNLVYLPKEVAEPLEEVITFYCDNYIVFKDHLYYLFLKLVQSNNYNYNTRIWIGDLFLDSTEHFNDELQAYIATALEQAFV
jgi:hypothetical protein